MILMGCFRRRQQGQALVLSLVLVFAASFGMMLLFASGKVVTTKQRLVMAADAAAWSAGAWRARVFNYTAYANRAIVFQEVAVAQAVTLRAWTRYFETLVDSAQQTLSFVLPEFSATLAYLSEAARYARQATDGAAALDTWLREAPGTGYKTLLASSTELLHLSAGVFGLSAVANEVARANDTSFFAFALPDAEAFGSFTRRYTTNDERGRLRDIVWRSLDAFVREPRSLDVWLPLPSSCFGQSADLRDWVLWLRKRGGTVMAPQLERWESADTLSLHDTRRSGWWFFGSCNAREAIPLGWGAAEAGERSGGVYDEESGWAGNGLLANPGNVMTNPGATARAVQGISDSPTLTYSGVARIRDLDYARFEDARFPVSSVAILARVEAKDVRSPALPAANGRLGLADRFASGRLWALSSSEVYFRRPPQTSGRIEYASLYNPYWQVRLKEPSMAYRAEAQAYVALR